jgi:glycosyltransferase involved in cell wall biosynthesis
MSHADVFVLNSSYEGFSHLLIEAQALGVPSVATAVGGNPELITSGENGVLVPAGDTKALGLAIHAILNDSAGAVQLRERARERAKAFTPELMVEKTKQLLLSV